MPSSSSPGGRLTSNTSPSLPLRCGSHDAACSSAAWVIPTLAWTRLGRVVAALWNIATLAPQHFRFLCCEVNNLNIRETPEGLFAHVVTANQRTFDLVHAALVSSGLPSSAINLGVVPSDIGGALSERAAKERKRKSRYLGHVLGAVLGPISPSGSGENRELRTLRRLDAFRDRAETLSLRQSE